MPREYPCTRPDCDKTFQRKGDLRRHVSGVHENSKAYKCKQCTKAFNQRSGLRTHENKHTGNKPHKCPEPGCHKSFGDPSSCKRHVKETHGNYALYVCPVDGCTSCIKRRSTFDRHLRNHGLRLTKVEIEVCNIKKDRADSTAPLPIPEPQLLFSAPAPLPAYHDAFAYNTIPFTNNYSVPYANHAPQSFAGVSYGQSTAYLEQTHPNNMYSTSPPRPSSQTPELSYSPSPASSPSACLTPEPLVVRPLDMQFPDADDSVKLWIESLAASSWASAGPSMSYQHQYRFVEQAV
uniref:C2H2-type domain-containing protein n=1 Tax=Moniliophthora roreri TaxID=221103 RepID=A0A0W0GAM0_MONRR